MGVVVHFIQDLAEEAELASPAITAESFPPDELLAALRLKLQGLAAPDLAGLETGLEECLAALRAARLATLEARLAKLEAGQG